MKKQLFPKEIIDRTIESHFAKHNIRSMLIYTVVLLSLLAIGASLPLIDVDITIQSRGIIRSLFENNTITAAVYGQVVENYLQENKEVTKGDTLLVMKTSQLDEQIRLSRQNQAQNLTYMHDLAQLIKTGTVNFQSPLYKMEYLQYKEKTDELKRKIAQAEREYLRSKSLFEKDVVPKVEFEEKEYRYQLAKKALSYFKEQQKNQWQAKFDRCQLENSEYYSQSSRFVKEKEQYVIIAPVSGTIIQYSGVKTGNFLTPGQKLASISPNNDLIVECYVSPKDIGLIRENMPARYQIDAYNYNQWGMANGQIVEIRKDLQTDNNQSFFVVRCSMTQSFLQLKNGYIGNLKKGLTLTSRFTITRRSLFQLLYDKVDDWLNPKIKNVVIQ